MEGDGEQYVESKEQGRVMSTTGNIPTLRYPTTSDDFSAIKLAL